MHFTENLGIAFWYFVNDIICFWFQIYFSALCLCSVWCWKPLWPCVVFLTLWIKIFAECDILQSCTVWCINFMPYVIYNSHTLCDILHPCPIMWYITVKACVINRRHTLCVLCDLLHTVIICHLWYKTVISYVICTTVLHYEICHVCYMIILAMYCVMCNKKSNFRIQKQVFNEVLGHSFQ